MAHQKTYGKRRSLRHPGVDYSLPYIYHVTVSSHNRRAILSRDEVAAAIVDNLIQLATNLSYEIFAFCILPDHLHILCQPRAEAPSLETFVGKVKGRISRELGKKGVKRPIWQRGFYDHILRKEEDVLTVAKYIAENPVRQGIVGDYEEYPYSYIRGAKPYQTQISSP